MKTNNQRGENVSENSQEKQVKKLLVLAAVGLKLARKIQEQLESIEVSLDIIAQEIARQSKPGE